MTHKAQNTKDQDPKQVLTNHARPFASFEALIDEWRQPIVVPDDPELANRVLTHIKQPPTTTIKFKSHFIQIAAAAILAIAAGLELGQFLYGQKTTESTDSELITAANDLGLNPSLYNPYDNFITKQED